MKTSTAGGPIECLPYMLVLGTEPTTHCCVSHDIAWCSPGMSLSLGMSLNDSSAANGAGVDTNYLLDGSGNVLADASGNRLVNA